MTTPQNRISSDSLTYLSLRTTPSMQAPNRTTELISAAENEGEFLGLHSPPSSPILSQQERKQLPALWPSLPTVVPAQRCRIQTAEVVAMAKMVPVGIDFWASRRSPERLEPAMIPVNRAAGTGTTGDQRLTEERGPRLWSQEAWDLILAHGFL